MLKGVTKMPEDIQKFISSFIVTNCGDTDIYNFAPVFFAHYTRFPNSDEIRYLSSSLDLFKKNEECFLVLCDE